MSHQTSGSNLHRNIMLGLILGAVAGITVNQLVGDPKSTRWLQLSIKYLFNPVGEIFLRLLFLTVIPLVFTSLALGVARLGDITLLGRIGVKTFAYFLLTTAFAVAIGLVLVNLIQPGVGLPEETRINLEKKYESRAEKKLENRKEVDIDTFINIVPKNPFNAAVQMDMLAIIFVALLTGIAITRIETGRRKVLLDVLEGIGEIMVFIIHLAMRIAPFGVFCLIFQTAAEEGIGFFVQLGKYVFVVLLGLSIQMFVVYPILVKYLGGWHPLEFFQRARSIIITALSTSSSNATLPTTIRVSQEQLNVPPPIAGFVLPLGATTNMNGTALFEGVTVVFLAQVFNIPLDLSQQLLIILLCVLTAVGAAGIPGGSIPLLVMVLIQFRIPAGAIALILGVDRFLDMCRTTLNVVGDVTAAVYIAKSEQGIGQESLTNGSNPENTATAIVDIEARKE